MRRLRDVLSSIGLACLPKGFFFFSFSRPSRNPLVFFIRYDHRRPLRAQAKFCLGEFGPLSYPHLID